MQAAVAGNDEALLSRSQPRTLYSDMFAVAGNDEALLFRSQPRTLYSGMFAVAGDDETLLLRLLQRIIFSLLKYLAQSPPSCQLLQAAVRPSSKWLPKMLTPPCLSNE